MIDLYKIGVAINLTSNAPQVLAVLMRHLTGVHTSVKNINKDLGGMKTALTTIGAAAVVGGIASLTGKLIHAGAQVADVTAKLRALGDTDLDIKLDVSAAQATALKVGGITQSAALQQLLELRSVTTNEGEARTVLPAYSTAARDLAIFNKGHGGTSDMATILPLLKAAELQGAFNNPITHEIDANRIAKAIQAGEAAMELTNGVLTGSSFMRMTNLAGPAAQQLSWETWIREMTEATMAMGPTAGRGSMMAFKTLAGGNLTKAESEALAHMGLVGQRDILKDHGHYSLKSGSLAGYGTLLSGGLDAWLHEVVLPKLMARNGGKPLSDAQLLSQFASFPITMQRLLAFFNTNEAQVKKFGTQFDQRMGTDANATLMQYSVGANTAALSAAWTDLMQTLGGPLAQPTIAVLHGLTDGIKAINAVFEHDPGLGIALMGIGATLGTWGFLRTTANGLKLVGSAFGLPGFAAAGTIGIGLGTVATGLTALGAAMSGFGWIADWMRGNGYANKPGETKHFGLHNPNDNLPGVPGGLPGTMRHGPRFGAPIEHESYMPPSGQPTVIRIENVTNLDGRVIARTVSEHQARSMSMPPSGTTGFDGKMQPSWPSSSVAI